jgi:hypothetical protein
MWSKFWKAFPFYGEPLGRGIFARSRDLLESEKGNAIQMRMDARIIVVSDIFRKIIYCARL